MRYYQLVLIFFVSACSLNAQDRSDSLWGNQKFRFGFSIQVAPSIWNQNNLNSMLAENNMPETRSLAYSVGVGPALRWNKLSVTMLAIASSNKNSNKNEKLQQQFGGGEINAEYFIIRKKNFAVSPIIGGGFLNGLTRIRQNATAESFPTAISNRNTTELFNRMGYINAALNFGFDYSPRLKDHNYQIAVGYRFGFAGTSWSTDPKKEVLSGAPTDELRQVYLAIKVNFLFLNRKR